MDPLTIVGIPLFYFFVVRPIVWVLCKYIPDGRVKIFLFRKHWTDYSKYPKWLRWMRY